MGDTGTTEVKDTDCGVRPPAPSAGMAMVAAADSARE
jgi:hypothetical protein